MTNTQAVIIAFGIALAGVGFAWGQGASVRSPAVVTGCIFYTTPPTLSDGQQQSLTCDSTGKLRVTTTF